MHKTEKESSFGFDELFFSRTDKRGVIKSGNSVFQRVSQYEWDEMLEKPHNVVRHPLMPRGVFSLLWDTIGNDQMIGAYVNNQAKDGSYYWVFALVSPIEDGYLSVRLKPSSKYFEIVKEKYNELHLLEKRKKLSPKESQERLLQMIQELGFIDYKEFMIEALMEELNSRQKALNQGPLAALCVLENALESGSMLQKKSELIFEEYQKTSMVPMNLEVQSARIGQAAASLATISSQYDNLAKEIHTEINKFVESGKIVQQRVKECQFYVCNSILQQEIYNFFENETKATPVEKSNEMKILNELRETQISHAKTSLNDIKKEFSEFKKVCNDVKKLSIGLEMVSISGKIEAAKLSNTSGELHGLLRDLGNFKDTLKSTLNEINSTGDELLRQTYQMNESLSA